MKIILLAFLLSLVYAPLAAVAGTEADPTRQLRLVVTVRSQADGRPIDRIGIVVAGESGPIRAFTDSSGVAEFGLTVPAGKERLIVAVSEFGDSDPPEQWEAVVKQVEEEIARFREFTRSYSFRQHYIVPIPEGQGQLSLEIKGRPAVRVTGRLVNPDGSPAQAIVARFDSPMSSLWKAELTDDDGRFALADVPKGCGSFIYVTTSSRSRIRVIGLRAAQTDQDVDLGEVLVPEPISGSGRVRLTVAGFEATPPASLNNPWFVTVVSQDGELVALLALDPAGIARSLETRRHGGGFGDELPELPEGVYYAVTGALRWNRAAEGLVQLARAGRAAELDNAGVARFEVKGSGLAEVTVDGDATRRAILTLLPEN